jgi:hypothetical protein
MLRLMQAGLIAGVVQAIAVVAVTTVLLLCGAAASFAWPGIMSVGVAAFGANAHAAAKALWT